MATVMVMAMLMAAALHGVCIYVHCMYLHTYVFICMPYIKVEAAEFKWQHKARMSAWLLLLK